MSKNPNQADSFDQSPESESQEKTKEMCFGVFFKGLDASQMEALQKAIEDPLSKGQDMLGGLAEKAGSFIEGLKETGMNKMKNELGKLEGEHAPGMTVSGLGDTAEALINEKYNSVEDSATGALKDSGVGDTYEDVNKTINKYVYDYRIVKGNGKVDESALNSMSTIAANLIMDDQEFKKISDSVKNQVETIIKSEPGTKLTLHFDIFGFNFGAEAADFFEAEVPQFKTFPNVVDSTVDNKHVFDAGASALRSGAKGLL